MKEELRREKELVNQVQEELEKEKKALAGVQEELDASRTGGGAGEALEDQREETARLEERLQQVEQSRLKMEQVCVCVMLAACACVYN